MAAHHRSGSGRHVPVARVISVLEVRAQRHAAGTQTGTGQTSVRAAAVQQVALHCSAHCSVIGGWGMGLGAPVRPRVNTVMLLDLFGLI